MAACKEYNNLPPDHYDPNSIWDDPVDLSAKTVNIVKLYNNGTGQVKDREINGYSFVRRFCMHCVDPSCISACPVSALTKDPNTGVVKYNKDVCIGCRYCQIACPYNVPKFQWDQAFPQIAEVPALRPSHRPGRLFGLLRVLPHRRLHLRQRPGPPERSQTAAVSARWARWPTTPYTGSILRTRPSVW